MPSLAALPQVPRLWNHTRAGSRRFPGLARRCASTFSSPGLCLPRPHGRGITGNNQRPTPNSSRSVWGKLPRSPPIAPRARRRHRACCAARGDPPRPSPARAGEGGGRRGSNRCGLSVAARRSMAQRQPPTSTNLVLESGQDQAQGAKPVWQRRAGAMPYKKHPGAPRCLFSSRCASPRSNSRRPCVATRAGLVRSCVLRCASLSRPSDRRCVSPLLSLPDLPRVRVHSPPPSLPSVPPSTFPVFLLTPLRTRRNLPTDLVYSRPTVHQDDHGRSSTAV